MDTTFNPFWNARERRLRALWRLLLFGLGFVLLASVLLVAGIVVVIAMGLAPTTALSPTDFTVMLLGAIASLAAAVGSMSIAARLLDRRPLAGYGLRVSTGWLLDLGAGLLLGALLMTGIFLAELGAGWVHITDTFATMQPDQSFVLAMIGSVVVFLCVGIYEELIFRGYLLTNVAEGLNLPRPGPRGAILIAWLLTSALFGVAHMFNPNATLISTFNITLAGLFLGLGYVLTGELALPIGLHITWNFFQGSVFGFPVSGGSISQSSFFAIEQRGPVAVTGGSFGPEAGLIGIVAILTGSALIVLWVRVRRGSIGLHLPLAEPPTADQDEQTRQR